MKEKARDRVKITLSLDGENVRSLKKIAEDLNKQFDGKEGMKVNFGISDMIDTCIEIGLADPYLNGKIKLEDFE